MRYILASCLILAVAIVLLAVIGTIVSESDRTAVVDRLGDDYAVLLIGGAAETTDQRVVDPKVIPEAGRHEGAILYIDDDDYRYSESATVRRGNALSRRFDALAERL